MLKIKIIEHYKPPTKTLELLNNTTNIKLEITNEYAQVIKRTNVKQIFPIIYKINNSLIIYLFNIFTYDIVEGDIKSEL